MIHLIINPKAGERHARMTLKKIEKVFSAHGIDHQVHKTTYAGAAKDIARKLTEEDVSAKIVAVGGDGTLHEVLNGVVDPTQCTIGLIPSGTGNDFAETAGIPKKVKRAAELIAMQSPKMTDWLEIGGKRCMNVGGLGMDVDVLLRCAAGHKHGKFKYIKSLIASFIFFKGYEVSFECEGETTDMNGLIVVACNGRQFGGGVKICPAAELDDGLMDVMAVPCFEGKLQTIKAFITLMRAKIMDYPYKKHYRCKSVSVRPKTAKIIQLDGELYEGLTYDATVRSGLKFYR